MFLEQVSKDKAVARLSGIKTKTSGSYDTGSLASAGRGSRTPTPLRAYAPETYASTSSAIPAKLVSKAGANVRAFYFFARPFLLRP